jgi:hypothetical protein
MVRVLKKTAYVLSVPFIAMLLLLSPVFVSEAATLNSAYVMLSRMQANLTSTANLELYIAFETSGAVDSGSTLTLEFPDGDDTNWCQTAGSDLTVTGVSSTPADSTGAYDIDSALPGTLSASCSQGSGSGSVDTITVTGLTALSSVTTYGVKISNGSTAKLGTSSAGQKVVTLTVDDGSDPETKSFGINLVSNDQVQISAEVVNPPTVTCSLSTNSVDLGNLYRGGMYVTGSHTISASTSDNAAGYYWVAYGQGDGSTNAGLYKSSATTYLIESDNSSATVDISTPGSEGFGMNVEVPTDEAVAGTGFGDNSDGVFGSLGMGVSNAELISYRNWGPQTTTADTTITYGARAGSSAEAGSYSETVTFVCGGYFGGYEGDPYLWTLDYADLEGSSPLETSIEEVGEDVTLHMTHTLPSTGLTIEARKNGSLITWGNDSTLGFNEGDQLSIKISSMNTRTINFVIRIDNSEGRVVADFDADITGGF